MPDINDSFMSLPPSLSRLLPPLLLVYETVRTLHNERRALLATLVLALAPAHVIMAQQMRADEISALLTALQ